MIRIVRLAVSSGALTLGACGPIQRAGASGDPVESAFVGTLVSVPPGRFRMGSPPGEAGRDPDEARHNVEMTGGFHLMEAEVTQAQWRFVFGEDALRVDDCGEDCPIVGVSWADAVLFASRVSEAEGRDYRLPTEAEWEWAARGGEGRPYAGGRDPDEVAWYASDSRLSRHPVRQLDPNGFLLYDMSGNVWEWTADWYEEAPGGGQDPSGPETGTTRVVRGGGWFDLASSCRVANRDSRDPELMTYDLGFRLVLSY